MVRIIRAGFYVRRMSLYFIFFFYCCSNELGVGGDCIDIYFERRGIKRDVLLY